MLVPSTCFPLGRMTGSSAPGGFSILCPCACLNRCLGGCMQKHFWGAGQGQWVVGRSPFLAFLAAFLAFLAAFFFFLSAFFFSCFMMLLFLARRCRHLCHRSLLTFYREFLR